jgi:hypothetical protein
LCAENFKLTKAGALGQQHGTANARQLFLAQFSGSNELPLRWRFSAGISNWDTDRVR